jgi:hypothetical protein
LTAQVVTALVGNNTLSREFTDDATDGGVFLGNNLLDTNSSQNIGILLPNTVITQVQVNYTAGLCQWRIFDSVTQGISRVGFGSKANYVCPMETAIPTYTLKKTDILQVFPKAVNATAGDSEVLAWVYAQGMQAQSFQATTTQDNAATEMTNSVTGQTIGDGFFGKMLNRICLQAEDGSHINDVELIDQTGSVVWKARGNFRLPTAGGKSTQTNLDIPCGVMIQKGWALKVSATNA